MAEPPKAIDQPGPSGVEVVNSPAAKLSPPSDAAESDVTRTAAAGPKNHAAATAKPDVATVAASLEKTMSGAARTENALQGATKADKTAAGVANAKKAAAGEANAKKAAASVTDAKKVVVSVTNAEKAVVGVTNAEKSAVGVTNAEKAAEGVPNAEKTAVGVTNAEKAAEGVPNAEKTAVGATNAEKAAEGVPNAEKTAVEATDAEKSAAGVANAEKAATSTVRVAPSARAGRRPGPQPRRTDETAASGSDAEQKRSSAAGPTAAGGRGGGRRRADRSDESGRESTPHSHRSSQSPAPARRQRQVSAMDLGGLREAPVFRPSEREFADPIGYLEKIRPEAELHGLCRVVPPPGFKPECRVHDDMRFVAYNHYVHKVYRRWGPNFRELLAIRRHLEQQQIDMEDIPLVGGMEVDLPGLYHTVQRLGGLNDVITGRRWAAVADLINIPKCAQDRAAKLDQIYCKFLLGYTALTEDERKRLRIEVETEWRRRQQTIHRQQTRDADDSEESDEDDDDASECIVKGKTISLSAFYRVARNTASLLFKQGDPKPETVEDEYWKVVNERDRHVCVYSGSIDSGVQGYGFVCDKKSQTSRLAWNLKVLSNNPGSVLRSMGHVMGVTVPTLHMSMAFTTGCWYSDPHCLPWVEYLHTGASKVWYSVPASAGEALRHELADLMPGYLRQQPVWLPSDTAMVPPDLLAARGVPVSRTVQQPGEFVISFPRAFTASIGTGYTLAESVFFATPDWLDTAPDVFDRLSASGEPSIFALDRLVLGVCSDQRASLDALTRCRPLLEQIRRQQHSAQQRVRQAGVTRTERISSAKKKRKSAPQEEDERECDTCRRTLYSAMVENTEDELTFCLEDAADVLKKPGVQPTNFRLLQMYSQSDFEELLSQVDERIADISSKQGSAKKKQKKS